MTEYTLTDNPEPVADSPRARSTIPCSRSCRRHTAMKPVLAAMGWLGAVVASLFVAAIPFDSEESVCGVWGCFPPLQALAALHLLWCVVLAAMVRSIWKWRPGLLLPIGCSLFILAAAATAGIVGRDLQVWFDRSPESFHLFWYKRIAYTIATLTDVPLAQTLLAALVCIGLALRKARGSQPIRAE